MSKAPGPKKSEDLVETRGRVLVCKTSARNVLRKTPTGGSIVEIVFALPRVDGRTPENHHAIGTIEKIVAKNLLSIEQVRLGRMIFTTAEAAKLRNPFHWTEDSFGCKRQDDHWIIEPPKDAEVFTYFELSLLAELAPGIDPELADAEAFIVTSRDAQRPCSMKLELVAAKTEKLSYEEIAFELEKLAQMLRTERPERGFGSITVRDRAIGKWTIGGG